MMWLTQLGVCDPSAGLGIPSWSQRLGVGSSSVLGHVGRHLLAAQN